MAAESRHAAAGSCEQRQCPIIAATLADGDQLHAFADCPSAPQSSSLVSHDGQRAKKVYYYDSEDDDLLFESDDDSDDGLHAEDALSESSSDGVEEERDASSLPRPTLFGRAHAKRGHRIDTCRGAVSSTVGSTAVVNLDAPHTFVAEGATQHQIVVDSGKTTQNSSQENLRRCEKRRRLKTGFVTTPFPTQWFFMTVLNIAMLAGMAVMLFYVRLCVLKNRVNVEERHSF